MADVAPQGKHPGAWAWATLMNQTVNDAFDAMLAAWPPSTQVHQAAFYAQQALAMWMIKLPSLPTQRRGDYPR